MTRFFSVLLLPLAVLFMSAPSLAQTGGDPVAATTTNLSSQIEAHRAANPEIFSAVDSIRQQVPIMDARKRGRMAVLAPAFQSLGADALLPMLAMLIEDPKLDAANPESARRALRVGLLQAVGELRDPRSRDILKMIVTTDSDPSVVRVAAEGLGLLGTDADVAFLLSNATAESKRGRAVLSGLGTARRQQVASELVGRLERQPAAEEARILIEALGDIGNAMAWKTEAVKNLDDGEAVRNIAAAGLVDAYLRFDGELRKQARKAILVVDAPETSALIASARQDATDSQKQALNSLSKRVKSNPLRRLR